MGVSEILGWITTLLNSLGLMPYFQVMVIIFALLGFWQSFVRRN